MDVRLLGSGGFVPTDRRETSCVYLRSGSEVLLLDAGTGVRRLVTEPELVDGIERVSVVLTHFHLDHTIGLAYLWSVDVPMREVWAPGEIVADVTGEEVVHRLLDPPFLAPRREDTVGTVLTAVHELAGDVEIGPFRVETRVQPLHSTPSLALRVEGLAYCTDTAYDADNAAFARGARLLLHEAYRGADTTDDTTHSAAGEAGRVAAAAGVDRLVLVHVHPRQHGDAELAAFAQVHFPAAEAGRDGPLDQV